MTDKYQKPEYEKAIDEYVDADEEYNIIENYFMSGDVLKDLLFKGAPPERIIAEFKLVIEEMKRVLEDRNSKLQTAKNAFRSAVQLGPTQWRGPEGKATTITYGPFSVSSVTRRSWDAGTLLSLAASKGFDKEILTLKTIDKEGREISLIKTRTEVDYEGILTWLKQHNQTEVITGAYDEKEVTPAVKGPKPLAFLGEKKKED